MADAEKTFNFELVSPSEKMVSEPIVHVVIPGEEGEMGIGKNHAAYVVTLKSGIVKLYKKSMGETPQKIFIAGGFADINGEQCSILAEEAIDVKDLDKTTLEQELKTLDADLKLAVEEEDKKRISDKLRIVQDKILASAA